MRYDFGKMTGMKLSNLKNFLRLLTVNLVLLSAIESAQAYVQLGVLGALASTGVEYHDHAQPENTTASGLKGYKLGLEGDKVFDSGVFGVEIDVLSSSYQWKENTTNGSGGFTTTYRTKWLEIPLIFNVMVSDFKFGLGPVVDIETDSQKDIGKSSIGALVQAGYVHSFPSGLVLTAELRYVLGVTDIATPDDVTTKVHSLDFIAGAGARF